MTRRIANTLATLRHTPDARERLNHAWGILRWAATTPDRLTAAEHRDLFNGLDKWVDGK